MNEPCRTTGIDMTISRRRGNKISRKTVLRPWRTTKRGYLHGPLRSQSNCPHPSRRTCRGCARSQKECRESALAARVARAQLQDQQNEIVALQERVRIETAERSVEVERIR